jgi:hypothetical protein
MLYTPDTVCSEENGRIRSYKRRHWSGCNTGGGNGVTTYFRNEGMKFTPY